MVIKGGDNDNQRVFSLGKMEDSTESDEFSREKNNRGCPYTRSNQFHIL